MRLKYTGAMAAALLLASATVSAQQGQASDAAMPEIPKTYDEAVSGPMFHELTADGMMIAGLDVTFADLLDMQIYGIDGTKIGNVDKVLADSSNTVRAVTVQVGGFLGIGSKEAVVPIDRLQKGNEKDRLVTQMTKADIERLDEWSADYRGETAPHGTGGGSAPTLNTPAGK